MVSRRAFLRRSTALGAGALAARPATLEAVTRATAAVAAQAPDQVAQDEGCWRGIQEAFDVDRTFINLNNGSSSPSPRVVQDASQIVADTTRIPPRNHMAGQGSSSTRCTGMSRGSPG